MIDSIRRILSCTFLLIATWIFPGESLVRAQADSAVKPDSPPATTVSADLPKYDVATIKPTSATDGRVMFRFIPGGISLTGVQVQMMLREAFAVEDDHIVGAPGWVKTNRYDVQAKVAPEDAPKLDKLKIDERRAMMLPLLVERFNLKYHRETRELPSYTLVVAKGGPKMKPSEVQSPPPDANSPDPGTNAKPGDPAALRPQQRRMMMDRGHLEAEGAGIEMLARILSQQLGRTVIDKTGLTGQYDFTLQWTPDDAPPPTPGGADGGAPRAESGSDAVGPSLFTALQEQLGLKLESSKGAADVIVIDHIDPPSEN